MKKLIFMSAICLVAMYSCKNHGETDVNVMPGASTETKPDVRDLKDSDAAKIIPTDTNSKVVN